MQHKSTASNSRGSHFLKEPISTDNANLNMKYRCLYNVKGAYSAAYSFHYAVRWGRGKNQTKTTSPAPQKKPKPPKTQTPHTHTKKSHHTKTQNVSSLEHQLYTSLSASLTKPQQRPFITLHVLKTFHSFYLFFSKRQLFSVSQLALVDEKLSKTTWTPDNDSHSSKLFFQITSCLTASSFIYKILDFQIFKQTAPSDWVQQPSAEPALPQPGPTGGTESSLGSCMSEQHREPVKADSVQDRFVSIPVDAGACTAPGQRKKKHRIPNQQ